MSRRRRRPKAATANDPATAARIRAQRHARKVKQLALAEAFGITFGQLRQYEKDRDPISERRLEQIASLLDVPVTALSDLDGDAGRPRPTLSLSDSAGAMRLMRAYTALPTPRMRRALVNLAERMAGVGS
jgi:transcriptional regulator with XRE-family HTH domain